MSDKSYSNCRINLIRCSFLTKEEFDKKYELTPDGQSYKLYEGIYICKEQVEKTLGKPDQDCYIEIFKNGGKMDFQVVTTSGIFIVEETIREACYLKFSEESLTSEDNIHHDIIEFVPNYKLDMRSLINERNHNLKALR